MAAVIAFTGAGISVASGLPTFDFTWRGLPARALLSRSAFRRDPELFYDFFREALGRWGAAAPNAAHLALAQAGIPVITQNIDGLHQRAGSRLVCELHGNLREMLCLACGKLVPLDLPEASVPRCTCGGICKPNVVLFEEGLHDWEQAVALLQEVRHLLVVGTSLAVAPACYLPEMAAARGAEVEIINTDAHLLVPAALDRLRCEGVLPPAPPFMHA